MMRTHVEFRSGKFPAFEAEEAQVNPGRWGKRLAEWLRQKLDDHGIPVGEVYAEDWGWALSLRHDPFPMWIGCGNCDEFAEGFLVSIQPSKPFIRKWLFKKVSTTEDVERVAAVLDRILTADPDIRDVRWWREDEI